MKRYLVALVLLAGIVLAAAAILANPIGLDHNPEWGRGRIVLLSTGLLVIAVAASMQYRQQLTRVLTHEAIVPLYKNRVIDFLWAYRVGILAALTVLFALAIYVFFVSAGTWTNWPESTRYYDDLGAAFRAGRLDLNIQPIPELMALTDPYEPSQRSTTTTLHNFTEDKVWDLSFYKGKFYLYWGPAPALLLAFVKLFYSGAIPDQYLAFVFLSGLLIFSTLLLLRLRRAFYKDVPASLVVAGILVTALVCPIPWMLNRAAIYEATIAGGQFFLIGGLYFAYTALEREPISYLKLVLASVFWAFAACSRTLILIPAAFLTFMVILWMTTDGGRRKPIAGRLPSALLLALPLVLGTLAAGWYNWARFGSAFETGLRYTLTFRNLDKYYSQTFSPYYALPSLWTFFFSPFELRNKFPFLLAIRGTSPGFLFLQRLKIYNVEEITGLVFSAPFAFLSVVGITNTVRPLWNQYIRRQGGAHDRCGQLLLWVSLCLAGAALLTFAAIVLYFNLTMRFLAEFLPALIPLAVLGTWQGYRLVQHQRIGGWVYSSVVMLLALVTIIVSLLLAFSEPHATIQRYNLHLYRQMIRFFGGGAPP